MPKLAGFKKGKVFIMKRQLIACLSILILFLSPLITAIPVQATSTEESKAWPDGPNVFAESAIVMEASTGLILYEKNINKAHYPASITKIMTALLAIENSNMGEVVTFSKNAVFDVDLDSSRIGIDVDEQLTMQQCLYGILLESANEVSYAVAEHVAGSVDEFAKMMTKRAKELGCLNTNFTNPHGLHDEEHYTSSYDMALITREAMKNDTFRKIFSSRTYQIPPTNIQSETRYLRNHHKFVLQQDYRYDDCIGGKTGYTSNSKFTLVSVAKRGDLELICVIMKDDSSEHQYKDTQKLFDYAFDNFSIYPIADLESSQALAESPMFTRYNPLLSENSSPISTDEKGYLILPNTASFEDAKKEVTFYSASEQTSTLQNNAVVGKISYTYNGKYVGGADILYHDNQLLQLKHTETQNNNPTSAPKDSPTAKADKSLRPVILGGIIGLFVLIIILYFVLVEAPRLKRRNAYYKKRAKRKSFKDDDFLNL
jgi:D-alanyl-D-alanine carboxypeptidase